MWKYFGRKPKVNNVQLLGNLVRDVELRYTQSGSSVATFTVAATSTYKGQTGEAKELTAFVNCVAWGKNGEYMSQFMKGQKVFVQGRLQTRSYEAQDGTKRYVTEVVADFCTGQEPQQGSQAQATSNFDSMTTSHEEIPF